MAPQIPLAWERLLWTGRSVRPGGHGVAYVLTDFRLVRVAGDEVQEVALHDMTEIRCTQSRVDRLFGSWTLVVATAGQAGTMVLGGVRRGIQLAALLEIFSGEPQIVMDADAVRSVLDWQPHRSTTRYREASSSAIAVVVAIAAAVHLLHGTSTAAAFAPDDPIYRHGEKRPRAEIVEFMQQEVMPWARVVLGRIKGGADRITCETCHGGDADALGWQMPAVALLPQPDLRGQGWEMHGGSMDAQIRNAIYGYLADADKQARAGYMREIVMPGMARLLHRPPYDFTQPYFYNRSRLAFGCYHCHRVK